MTEKEVNRKFEALFVAYDAWSSRYKWAETKVEREAIDAKLQELEAEIDACAKLAEELHAGKPVMINVW